MAALKPNIKINFPIFQFPLRYTTHTPCLCAMNMKIRTLILLPLAATAFASVLTACSPNSEAQEAIKRLLNDPESAKFADVITGNDGNVCGRVNAKNRMGGYVGTVPFFYQAKVKYAAIVPPVEDSDFRSLWLSIKLRSTLTDELTTLNTKCMHMSQWSDVCGSPYPYRVHDLCAALSQGGASIYESLRAEFD